MKYDRGTQLNAVHAWMSMCFILQGFALKDLNIQIFEGKAKSPNI